MDRDKIIEQLEKVKDHGFCNKCGHCGPCERTSRGLEHDGCNYLADPLTVGVVEVRDILSLIRAEYERGKADGLREAAAMVAAEYGWVTGLAGHIESLIAAKPQE